MPDIKSILKEFGTVILCLALLAYVIIRLVLGFTEDITTESAVSVSLEDSFVADGYIMRSEEYVNLEESGTIVPAVAEGDRVSVGEALFSIYNAENDIGIENEINAINEKIDALSKSSSETGSFVAEIGQIDEKIESGLTDILTYAASNSLLRATNITDDVLVNMNKRWLITNGATSFEERISLLNEQKQSLSASFVGTPQRYYSKRTGYFSSKLDGYESVFDPKKLDTMSTSDFEEMIKAEPDTASAEKASGKLITSFKWRVLCLRTKKEASSFTVGAEYPVIFPFSYNTEILMTLDKIIAETNGDKAVLCFATSYMPQSFNYTRKQEVEIVKKRYTGLKVRKSAMRVVDGKKGVYVLSGNRIEFRYASELCEANDFYIIDETENSYLDKEGNPKMEAWERLALYDQVVIEGKNMYEGKIIE